jgi:hypothetical protein
MDRRVLGLRHQRRGRRADRLPRLTRFFSRASASSLLARAILIGQDVPPLTTPVAAPDWKLHELEWHDGPQPAVGDRAQ